MIAQRIGHPVPIMPGEGPASTICLRLAGKVGDAQAKTWHDRETASRP